MRLLPVIAIMLNLTAVAFAGDADLNERRTKAAQYERQADWRLQFEDWDKLAVFGSPTANGAVVTIHMSKAKDITEALASIPAKRDLAVVVVSHRFHGHYGEMADREKQLDALSAKIRQAGFKRVVLVSETAVGHLLRKE